MDFKPIYLRVKNEQKRNRIFNELDKRNIDWGIPCKSLDDYNDRDDCNNKIYFPYFLQIFQDDAKRFFVGFTGKPTRYTEFKEFKKMKEITNVKQRFRIDDTVEIVIDKNNYDEYFNKFSEHGFEVCDKVKIISWDSKQNAYECCNSKGTYWVYSQEIASIDIPDEEIYVRCDEKVNLERST